MKTNYNNLPDELKRRGLFCLWRYEKVNGRLSKIPYSLHGGRAKSTDRKSFCDFNSAVNVVSKYSGIGLGIFDGYCAVDIDHCVADGRLSELWSGNFDKSHSEADLALCSMLAFWCGGDSAQIDRLFRRSVLYREKWERDDYRGETIKKAVAGCTETYLQKSRASDDFSDSLMDKLKELKPEQNPKYPETDIGAGRLFADCYKDIARYVPERKCWYCYEDGVWKQDVGSLRAMEYLKELADALMSYALKIDNEYRRTQ